MWVYGIYPSKYSCLEEHLHPLRYSLPLPYWGIRNSCRHSAQLAANIITLDRDDLVVSSEGDATAVRLRRCGTITKHGRRLELRQSCHTQDLEKRKKLEMKLLLSNKEKDTCCRITCCTSTFSLTEGGSWASSCAKVIIAAAIAGREVGRPMTRSTRPV